MYTSLQRICSVVTAVTDDGCCLSIWKKQVRKISRQLPVPKDEATVLTRSANSMGVPSIIRMRWTNAHSLPCSNTQLSTRRLRCNTVDVIVKDDPQPVHLIFIAGISWTCVIVVSLVFSPKARFSASVSAAPLALPTADTFAMMFQETCLCKQAQETDGLFLAHATNKNHDVVLKGKVGHCYHFHGTV